MQNLTKRIVESAEIKKKPYFIFDNLIKGFGIKISSSGRRNYYFQYFKTKYPKRMLLGQHGVITTAQARDMATAMHARIKAGGDPHKDRTDKEREPLVRDVAQRLVDEHVAVHCKVSTQKGHKHFLDKHIIPFLGNIKISELNHSDTTSLHHSLRNTPYHANRCIEVLSKLCNFAEKNGLRPVGSNPCKHVKSFVEKARDRYLSEEEVERLAKVLCEFKQYPDENISAVYCIQLLLFTGCRLSEIRTLKWEYIDQKNKLLRLPDSKTGAKTVYAGSVVMNLLEEIKHNPSRPRDNIYVLWSNKKPGYCINNVHKTWKRVCKLADLIDIRIHDLRHSFASLAVNKGVSALELAKLLDHKQIQTTKRYAHLLTNTITATAENITSSLGHLFNVKPTEENQQEEKDDRATNTIKGTTIKMPVYLTSDQAAQYLGVKPRLMEYWRWRKTGPDFIKVGSRIRYRLEALEEFMHDKLPRTA